MPRAPLPLSGFIRMVGRASTKRLSIPTASTPRRTPSIRKSIAPDARKTPTPTSTATRYGMMPTAVRNPSFAPSMKQSYTFIFLRTPLTMNPQIIVKSNVFANSVE